MTRRVRDLLWVSILLMQEKYVPRSIISAPPRKLYQDKNRRGQRRNLQSNYSTRAVKIKKANRESVWYGADLGVLFDSDTT